MKVVSNSGPLISLSQIGEINLLRGLYGTIIIPDEVEYEIVIKGSGKVGAKEIDDATWIKVKNVHNKMAVKFLRERLDAGESEAIILATELQADLLLMDEARGRRIAESHGTNLIGTLGLLVIAKQQGLIVEIKPLLNQLINLGFRMSSSLYQTILEQAGENRLS